MDKKTHSKPMKQILDRLRAYGDLEVVVFGNNVILKEPVENWPVCDALISFVSAGFPLEKATEYVRLRQPFCINDLASQTILQDRSLVYKTLAAHGIPTPRHLYVDRSSCMPRSSSESQSPLHHGEGCRCPPVTCNEEYIEVGEERLSMPVLEKPFAGDDHNIHILYGHGQGGRRLFRKVKNRSSEADPQLKNVRESGSFVYEEFMPGGKDLKVYTVGMLYSHAETRKSPTVDGTVERDPDGKELRLLTRLTAEEKEIARKVVHVFKQNICGFDIIRWRSKSYVIDINGWSFVKGNLRYYDKCARILRKMVLGSAQGRAALALPSPLPSRLQSRLSSARPPNDESVNSFRDGENNNILHAIVAVFRHADRTPKQKVKFVVDNQPLLQLFPASGTSEHDFRDLKFKDSETLDKIERVIEHMYDEAQEEDDEENEAGEESKQDPQDQRLRAIAAEEERTSREGSLSTSTHSAHLRRMSRDLVSEFSSQLGDPDFTGGTSPEQLFMVRLAQARAVLMARPRASSVKVQLKALKFAPVKEEGEGDEKPPRLRVSKAQCIIKWGGEITHAGIAQTHRYAPLFWDEMLRPRPSLTPEPGEYPKGGEDALDPEAEYSLRASTHAKYTNAMYIQRRRGFIRGMQVFAGDEERVIKTAQEFIAATLHEPQTDRSQVVVHHDKAVQVCPYFFACFLPFFPLTAQEIALQSFLDDIPAVAQRMIHRTKDDISRIIMSDKALMLRDHDDEDGDKEKRAKGQEDRGRKRDSMLELEAAAKALQNATEVDLSRGSAIFDPARTGPTSMTHWGLRCLRWLKVPRHTLYKVFGLMKALQAQIHRRLGLRVERLIEEKQKFEQYSDSDDGDVDAYERLRSDRAEDGSNALFPPWHPLCHNESLLLLMERWDQLIKDFYDAETEKFDATKIPDVYDCIKYEVLHNRDFLMRLRPVYRGVKRLADFVIPQEFGILRQDKLAIARAIVQPLLNRIIANLEQGMHPQPACRAFLYFSSESHVHSLRNTILLSDLPANETVATALESTDLNYLSHGVFRLYEDLSKEQDDPERFYVNVQFSPGAALDPFIFLQEDHLLPVSRPVPVNGRIGFALFKSLFYRPLGGEVAGNEKGLE